AVEEMRETGETTEDRMSSAAVTKNTAHGPSSTPAGDAWGSLATSVTAATETAASAPGQMGRCAVGQVRTDPTAHRPNAEGVAEAGGAGTGRGAGGARGRGAGRSAGTARNTGAARTAGGAGAKSSRLRWVA